jgi:hypothetical protein
MTALAVVGGLVLSACQSAPGVAAYVGDVRITTAQIDDAMDKIHNDVKTLDPSKPNDGYGDVRRELIADLVFVEVAKRYAAEHGLSAPTVDYAGTAGQTGLPPSDPYIRARAEASAYQALIQSKITAGEPSDADIREVYDRVVQYDKEHDVDLIQGQSFDELKPAIKGTESVASGIALRRELGDVIGRYSITLNPRYLPLEYVITELPVNGHPPFPAVVLPLGASTVPVTGHD